MTEWTKDGKPKDPPAPRPANSAEPDRIPVSVSVWDGVKIGFGIFIVLPLIILFGWLILIGLATCGMTLAL